MSIVHYIMHIKYVFFNIIQHIIQNYILIMFIVLLKTI